MPDPRTVTHAAPQESAGFVPILVLRDPEAAASFYGLAFGAQVRSASATGADVLLGASRLRLVRADRQRGMLGPESFGGAPVLLALRVADLDAAVARATAHGAVLLRPAPESGARNVLLRDPFLHVWELAEAGG
jgi:uncharacterized glyoxalase superfamily protein PhnB